MAEGQPNLIAAALMGPEFAAVERVIERALAEPRTTLTRQMADEPAVRLLALDAYRQGRADEHELWQPPF